MLEGEHDFPRRHCCDQTLATFKLIVKYDDAERFTKDRLPARRYDHVHVPDGGFINRMGARGASMQTLTPRGRLPSRGTFIRLQRTKEKKAASDSATRGSGGTASESVLGSELSEFCGGDEYAKKTKTIFKPLQLEKDRVILFVGFEEISISESVF